MATKQNIDDERGVSILAAADFSLVYKPPRSATRRFFWKWRIMFEATFALTMLEGWEKFIIGAFSPSLDDVQSLKSDGA
jgi:hypothetical protein